MMLINGSEMNEFIEYVEKIRPWFERDGVGTDDEIFSRECTEHRNAIRALGEKIHAKYGIDGLFAAHGFADEIRYMGRFVELAFSGIGKWEP